MDEPTFKDLGLDERILEAVSALGFEKPTPIQAETIVPINAGRDVIGRARTGSGKTAAFGLPLLERVKDGERGVQGLILAPTRELAVQVTEALRTFAKKLPVQIVTIYGGADYEPQLRALKKGVPVVVGTPGRTLDHIKRGTLDLSGVKLVVLDEADEMLRMGFIEEVDTILAETPNEKQVVLFSATMPPPIQKVANRHLNDPVMIQVESAALTTSHIEQRWVLAPLKHKLDALMRILAAEERGATLIFARTRKSCGELADALAKRGVSADALHGDLNQGARERVLARLRAKSIDIVVATDVAARGIDVEHITHVVNFDLPPDVEQYVHRIGRTGRAGRKGVALNLVKPGAKRQIKAFERMLNATIVEVQVPSDADIQARALDQLRRTLSDHEPSHIATALASELAATDRASALAAAIDLLADARGLTLEDEPDDQPPEWQRAKKGPRRELTNIVELFFSVGRVHGVQAGVVVGALANEGDIPGAHIGRVTILPHKCFVEVEAEDAERFLRNHKMIVMRGNEVRVQRAFGRDSKNRPPPRRERSDSDRPKRDFDKPKRDFDRPKRDFDKPKRDFDKPKFEKKPKSDKPKSDKPKSDKPKGDKPKGDKPKGDKPKGDKPKGDKKPKSDKKDRKFDKGPKIKPKPKKDGAKKKGKPKKSKPKKGGMSPPKRRKK